MIKDSVSRGTIDGQPARVVLNIYNQKNARIEELEDGASPLNEKS